jgi:acetyl esterase/lipase
MDKERGAVKGSVQRLDERPQLGVRVLFRVLCLAAVLTATGAAGLAGQGRSPVDLANATVAGDALRLPYGPDPLQFGELRVPRGEGPHPVAIVVHGGCWVAQLGKMDPGAVSMANMRPLAAALTEEGIATWNIEYRRLGNDGGGWPGTFRDVAAAADYLRKLASAHRLDLTRVAAIGHSAGGHLAMWLGSRPRLSNSSELYTADPLRLAGVMNIDGPSDLQNMHPLEKRICGEPVITDLMAGSPDERPERYRDTSPIHFLPLGVAQEILAGRMFAEHAESYEIHARNAGDRVRSTVDANAGHFVFIDPESERWPLVIQAVRRLLPAK